MNEKFISQVDELPMDKPGIDLMKEDFVAYKEDAGKHVLDYWVATDTPLMQSVEELSTSESLLFDISV